MVSHEVVMARYYRRTFKKRSYRRRYPYYSYRRRYNYRKRRYKRSKRRSKVEYKRLEGSLKSKLYCTKYEDLHLTDDPNSPNQTGYIGDIITSAAIGPTQPGNVMTSDPIEQGVNIDKRIGNKINPVKFRCFGTMTLTSPNPNPGSLEDPVTVYVRMLIYQVRNGNPINNRYYQTGFSSMNPIYTPNKAETADEYELQAGCMSAETGNRLFSSFYGQDLWRYTIVMNKTIRHVAPGILETDITRYTSLAKVPFRLGIGGSVKILKDKVYKLSNVKNSFSFRFKTKKPNRMVWPENTYNGGDDFVDSPKNPIYICLFYIPTTKVTASVPGVNNTFTYFNGNVDVDLEYQLFYTDM